MKNKRTIVTFCIMTIAIALSITRCSHNASKAREYKEAVNYLNDTVTTYSDKLGRSSVQRKLLSANVKELKKINRSLYDELKVERKTKFITKTEVRFVTDTLYNLNTFTVVSDSILADVSLDLGSIIVGYDKDRRLFAKSTNPNVIIDSLDGVLLTERPRRIGVGVFFGPSVSYGILGRDLDFGVSLGVGVTFRLK